MSLSPNATPNSSPPLPASPAHDNDNLIPFTPSTTTSSTTSTEPSLSLTSTSATTLSVTSTTESTTTTSVEQKSVPGVAIDAVSGSLSNLSINSSDSKSSTDTKEPKVADEEEELSPEEAKLRANGLKSTHRPGFYIHINSPRRLRITTKSKTFDLDRYCPHANADLLKWGVLRTDMTLRCGVHYWGFDLVKNGQCIAHPDETLNACPAPELEW